MDTTDSLTAPMPIRRYPGRIAVLLGLVALADFLIFGQEPGINLFLFALAVCAGILLPATKELSPSKAALLLGLSLLASAPLLETPSAMGFALCLTALMSVALVSGKLMPRSLTGLPLAFSRFALVIPLRLAEDVGKYPPCYRRDVEEPRSYPVSMFENAASLGNWGCPIRRPTVGIATPNRQAYWLVLTRSLGVSR
ncbi:hypothetical protein [Rhizobium ruizarguesonis]|uniref:hypothetical protein n=1 Tax=Rhizobium ruizarguesonis TaxID=2081791 RepID=UPI0028BEFB52|nr:hypothetical protein [Rhizobium ruizarguesonis]